VLARRRRSSWPHTQAAQPPTPASSTLTHTYTDMSIQPLITFKAGKCDITVSFVCCLRNAHH
jgi:hypothetical protein